MSEYRVESHNLAHLKFTARWYDEFGEHRAVQHFVAFNVLRDMELLPQSLMNDIIGKSVGQGSWHTFAPGDLMPAWSKSKQKTVQSKNFIGRLNNGLVIIPHIGRFYPAGMVDGLDNGFHVNIDAMRLIVMNEQFMTIDFNHPLANSTIDIKVDVIAIKPAANELAGRCTKVMQELFKGPGMQIPDANVTTDFFVANAMDRIDEDPDDIFYSQPRLVHHLDCNARSMIADFYARHLVPGSHVLDLMASWESHINCAHLGVQLTGLGMNEQELQANPQLDNYLVHDLNRKPDIPLDNESFDAVICTASVEYLIRPLRVFEEIKRILKAEGQFLITFSNRWFPTKSIALWAEMHEFERIGLVSEYFRQAGWSGSVNTLSIRGLSRPEDDPYYGQTHLSDPVYAVWGQK